MNKLLFCVGATLLIACNNKAESGNNSEAKKADRSSATVMSKLSTESEMEILQSCVENAKASKLDEAASYALCRCVLRQVEEKYPNADSTELVLHLSDTAQVAKLAETCK